MIASILNSLPYLNADPLLYEKLQLGKLKNTKITHLNYATHINVAELKKMLECLEDRGLVKSIESGKKTTYFVTKEGKEWRESFRELQNMLDMPL